MMLQTAHGGSSVAPAAIRPHARLLAGIVLLMGRNRYILMQRRGI
ncbi:hypothetical protein ASZ90_010256 [hydrocarbon metagenome]|uniref:Uncharacterized protein n=1 Tax=hydrocarbon metagenome TaxID=938273 RepID=A0A0W8FGH6_9ZZZZ